jgi:hypothetical protein
LSEKRKNAVYGIQHRRRQDEQEEAGEAKAKAIALAMLKNGFAPDIVAANTESPVSKITELAARITVQNSC